MDLGSGQERNLLQRVQQYSLPAPLQNQVIVCGKKLWKKLLRKLLLALIVQSTLIINILLVKTDLYSFIL